jgi:hypothetical protein
MIDPPTTVPSMIKDVVMMPVKVQVQPASYRQPDAKGNERKKARSPSLNVHNRSIVCRDIYVLRLGGNDLNIITVDNNSLLIGTYQIPEVSRFPPQTLDRICHILRLIQKNLPDAGGPIRVVSHHVQNLRVVR